MYLIEIPIFVVHQLLKNVARINHLRFTIFKHFTGIHFHGISFSTFTVVKKGIWFCNFDHKPRNAWKFVPAEISSHKALPNLNELCFVSKTSIINTGAYFDRERLTLNTKLLWKSCIFHSKFQIEFYVIPCYLIFKAIDLNLY